jgi:hypothetical protein
MSETWCLGTEFGNVELIAIDLAASGPLVPTRGTIAFNEGNNGRNARLCEHTTPRVSTLE